MVGDSARQTALEIDLGGEQVLLERVEAVESLSAPFQITIDLISPLGELELLPHLGKPVTVTLSQDGELQRHFHGLAVEGEYTRESSEGFHYRLQLRPWTYFLSHNRDFAIYQELDAVQIVKRVVAAAGISDVDYTCLSKARAAREYCVQYGESDFAFVSRLLEDEGIYYHFRHSEDRHVMVLCEGPSSHSDASPAALTFNPLTLTVFNTDSAARTSAAREYFIQSWVERVTTGGEAKVTVRDFDFEKPERPLEAVAEAAQDHPRDALEVYEYPGGYKEESEGKKLGSVALDSLRTDRRTYRGQSQSSGLSCGAKVQIRKHPTKRLNASYLITHTFHSITAERYRTGPGAGEESYNVIIEALPATTQWRARRTTPRPVVRGLETAIVTGPDGEEIFTDEYGRVKVRFPWDRSDSPDEKSTCWMRVSQTGGLGNIILPRVGHEVLVDFLGGDPDRPIVVGRVFNRMHMPIYQLPENKTVALWRTKRYGASGSYAKAKELDTGKPGANELRFEDKGGKEEIFLHAERDMKTRIRHQESHHVGCDQEIDIGHDRQETVGNDEKVTITKNREVSIGTNDELTVGSSLKIKAGTTIEIEAGTSITLKVGGSTVKMDPTTIKLESPMIQVTAQATLDAKSPLTTVKGDGMLTLKGGITMIN